MTMVIRGKVNPMSVAPSNAQPTVVAATIAPIAPNSGSGHRARRQAATTAAPNMAQKAAAPSRPNLIIR